MSFWDLLVLAVGLSMDAMAVSICKGLALRKPTLSETVLVGVWFGAFQAGMPVLGYFLGSVFSEMIRSVDHWIAFVLLAYIGANMIRESFEKDKEADNDLGVRKMFLLAVATSIDALAVGVTLAFLEVNIWLSALLIGIVTFTLSAIGVRFGSRLGEKYGQGAERTGGIILILLGLRILLEHLGILTF
ncbi:MAG: manganese efflux pump [Erysipelotrichales bacterium]|nr:manganese efflux pump [Erysipelotrichales bacterium]MBQ1386488.1 manganese efflux pump [Erysipelotrichales bacterium]MBQ2309729.1 manganese efflux pump [Erysipelotrichales bacterium]MBQ2479075.1 manganese efflux pump [Erysipelotrichales bacterium]MBQ4374822.1 manganese efflux pump [Erysipelotrichales bacterium]